MIARTGQYLLHVSCLFSFFCRLYISLCQLSSHTEQTLYNQFNYAVAQLRRKGDRNGNGNRIEDVKRLGMSSRTASFFNFN